MRFIGGLLRRRYFFELSPVQELSSIEGSPNSWVANGLDPQFILISRSGRYPSGWVFLSSNLIRNSENPKAKLYFDIGQGFQESHSVFVPASRKGTIQEVLRLPRGIKALRWDPMESPGNFTQQPLVFTEITHLERMTRMAQRVVPLWKQHPEMRPALTRALSQSSSGKLKAAYEFAGRIRNEAKSISAKIRQEANPAPPTIIEYLRPNHQRLVHPLPDASIKSRYVFQLDVFNHHSFEGWAIDRESPEQPVVLDLYINEVFIERKPADLERQDVAAQGHVSSRCGFLFFIPQRVQSAVVLKAKLCPAGSTAAMGGVLFVYTPNDILIRSLLDAVESLNRIGRSSDHNWLSPSLPATDTSVFLARQVLFPKLIEHCRSNDSQKDRAFASLPNVLAVEDHPDPIEAKVDVIIPAYKGLDETMQCIASVLEAQVTTPYELIVINDCSPEANLTESLRKAAEVKNFNLIENKINLGFVRSVNLGMMQHRGRDVVLLNSDTVVTHGWLDRLRSAAYADTNIATVTPFSNRATICSFPLNNQDNDLPTGIPLAEVADAFSRVNAGHIIDLPTAIGFCMYIRREALRETGYFDELLWDKGYGEENDFCLRASARGWRHVIACDAFVRHHGSVSFLTDASALSAKNSQTINRLYPDYHHTVMRFIQNDPLANYRRQVFMELAKRYSARYILFISHSLGGGADFAAHELARRLTSENQWVLTMTALPDERIRLSVFGTNLSAFYEGASRYAQLQDDLQRLNVWLVQVHQLIGYSHEIYDLIKNLGASYDITLHDYYYICPRVNLIDAFENYCGEPDENGCRQCVDQLNTHVFCQNVYRQLGSDISAWRDHHSQFFQNARRIFAPSYDIERRMRKYFNFSNVLVRPHPELPAAIHPRRPAPSSILSVAIIGAIGLLKGFRVIIGCAEDAQQRNLPIRYVVIGYTCDDNALKNFTNVIITGKYERSELGNLLIKYNCGIAAFFSVCPETYSYTLSEAWSFGLFPISFDIGAIAERIKLNGFGLTIPFPSTPQVINDHLIKIGKELETYVPQNSFGQDYSNIIQDYYDFDKDKPFC